MAKFEVGDRVRALKDIPAEELNGWPAPAGSAGTVRKTYSGAWGYEVLLDDHPDGMSFPFGKDEIEAES